MSARRLPQPSELAQEGEWIEVLQTCTFSTRTGGDWKSYPHLSSHKMWREHMRPCVQVLSDFLEAHRIYLECPIQGCNMQGSYTDHVTSTNGSHFKHLWQRTKLFKDGEPLERTREHAWEQINIAGGAVRFNHLDWQVLMWRGAPPPAPVFDGDGPPPPPAFVAGAPQQLLAAGGGPPLGLWPAGVRQGRAAQLTQLSRLPEEGLWYEVLPPISTPTTSADDWKSLQHVSCG